MTATVTATWALLYRVLRPLFRASVILDVLLVFYWFLVDLAMHVYALDTPQSLSSYSCCSVT